MNLKMTFLKEDNNEIISMAQLENFEFEDLNHLVCRIKKSIYNLKHKSYHWYQKFD